MSCILLILFVIVSCVAQALSTTEPEIYKINAVELSNFAASTESRIIGGTTTSIQNYPFMVQVLYTNNLMCGGSLLTRRHVLSAGHCFVDQYGVVASPLRYAVRAGTTYLNSGGVVHAVSAIIVHELYNQPVRANDVAVMLLSTSVTLTTSVQLASLPIAGENLPDNTTVVAIGWGRTNVNIAAASSVLNEVAVRIVNQEICARQYLILQNLTGEPFPVEDSMLCAGLFPAGGADACQGDSGGPLAYEGIVVGITSWGYSCAEPLFPGVYTRVSNFTNWINETVVRYNDAPRSHLVGLTTLLIPLVFVMLGV